jgi:hypothetical protein
LIDAEKPCDTTRYGTHRAADDSANRPGDGRAIRRSFLRATHYPLSHGAQRCRCES